jgi:hypothetical protein
LKAKIRNIFDIFFQKKRVRKNGSKLRLAKDIGCFGSPTVSGVASQSGKEQFGLATPIIGNLVQGQEFAEGQT